MTTACPTQTAATPAGVPAAGGMSLERRVRVGAGVAVLLGVMLGLHVHPLFHLLSALTGAALLWAGVTESCGLGLLLARAATERFAADPGDDLSM